MSQIKLYPGVLIPLSTALKFLLNSLRPSDTYIHPHTTSSLVQTMACQHQISILSDADLLPTGPLEHISVKNESQFSLKKIHLKIKTFAQWQSFGLVINVLTRRFYIVHRNKSGKCYSIQVDVYWKSIILRRGISCMNLSYHPSIKTGLIYSNRTHFEGILPKGPYLPCVSMVGRTLLAGYHRFSKWINMTEGASTHPHPLDVFNLLYYLSVICM